MVKVTVIKTDYGYIAMRIDNHAGDPLVCSAVSALGMALVGTLKGVDGLDIPACYYGSGMIDVSIHPFMDEQKQAVVDAIFETVYVGLKQIEGSYPNNINVEFRH